MYVWYKYYWNIEKEIEQVCSFYGGICLQDIQQQRLMNKTYIFSLQSDVGN